MQVKSRNHEVLVEIFNTKNSTVKKNIKYKTAQQIRNRKKVIYVLGNRIDPIWHRT